MNRSAPLTTKTENYEKINQLIASLLAGPGWSRDGPTANAGRIATTNQETGTEKRAARGKARSAEG
jgi:hypothetical protein